MCVPAPRDRHTMQTAADDEAYLAAHGVQAAIKEALLRVVRERPADPVTSIGALLSGQSALTASAPPKAASATPTLASAPAAPAMPAAPAAPAVSGGSQKETDAAATIAGYLKCMSTKLKVSGKGEQNCEMLMVSRTGGALSVEDYGGWALRNESITRMVRELDASGALPDFAPALIQTGDRCVARRTASGAPELHLWQSQPVPEELRRRIPLDRVLSMCATPKYADAAVPDWCFDAWPEAGVPVGEYDAACGRLAAAGAAPPRGRASSAGAERRTTTRRACASSRSAKSAPDASRSTASPTAPSTARATQRAPRAI